MAKRWWTDVKHDIRNVSPGNISVKYHAPKTDFMGQQNGWFEVIASVGINLMTEAIYAGIQAVAKKHDLTPQDFSSHSVDLINRE